MTDTDRMARPTTELRSRQTMFPSARSIFDGPGPTLAALRSVDWAATSLGEVDSWPADLVCAARTVVQAAAPMFVWWGTQFVQIHNDALIISLGGDRPAVGRPAIDCWPERWEVLGPPALQVVAEGRAMHLRDIVLPIDGSPTSYWTLAMAPLVDRGEVSGVLATAVDLTERVTALEIERASADAATANLQTALTTNRRIGTAIGVLMANRRITDTAAFDLLRDASQRGHRKLRDIAEDVVLTGTLPD